MSRKFEMEWPDFGITVIADLLDDENPKLCERYWQALPYETVPISSMSPGDMLLIPVPVTLPSTADQKLVSLPDQPPGMIVSFSGLGIFWKYGIIVEPFTLPALAMVPEKELDKFRGIAPKLNEAYFFTKKIYKVIIRKSG